MRRLPNAGLLVVGLLAGRPFLSAPSLAGQNPGPPGPDTLTVLSGSVRDPDARPLAGVEVIALGLGRVTFTNAEGAFRLRQLPPGTFEFHFRRLGFDLARRFVTLEPGKPLELDVELRRLVPVPDSRASLFRLSASVQNHRSSIIDHQSSMIS